MSLALTSRRSGSWRRRTALLTLPVLAVPALVTAATTVPAQAAEPDTRAWSAVGGGCTLAPDVEDLREYPGPVTASSATMSGTADATTHTASATASAILLEERLESPYGENCGFDSDFADVLTVRAGSSGLADGAPVKVAVTVALAGEQTNGVLPDRRFQTRSEMTAGLTVDGPRLDTCTDEWCSPTEELLAFDAWSERYVYSSAPWGSDTDGYVGQDFDWGWGLEADGEQVAEDGPAQEPAYELCSSFPCPDLELAPFVFPFETRTVEFTTRIGDELLVEGGVSLFVQAYDNPVTGAADFGDGLRAAFAPGAGSAGIELDFLSVPDAPADTVAPVLTVPDDISVTATSASGADISWVATATDAVDGAVAATCTPAPGLFPVGTTPVTCTATDAAGNTASESFDVVVAAPVPPVSVAQLFAELKQQAATMPTVREQFTAKLAQVERDVAKGATGRACKKLGDVVKSVDQRTGKGLAAQQAATLKAGLASLGLLLGC